MSMRGLLLLLALAVTGCKNPATPAATQETVSSDPLSYQLSNLGIARIRSTYSLASGQFQSTCSGALLHSGDQAVPECIVLSAASCFKHMPRIAEHSIEFFDPDGRPSKLFRAHDVLIHPSFDAPDAQLSLSETALDVALVKFNCTLPVSVRSVRIAAFDQVPVNGNLIAVHAEPVGPDSSAVRLMRDVVRIESIDFPSQKDSQTQSADPAGLITLRNTGGESGCSGTPGSPVFYQSGRELLLIASLSLPASDCLRQSHRYTLLSPHIEWMKARVGTGAVSYAHQLSHDFEDSAQATPSNTPLMTVTRKESQIEKSEAAPADVPLTLPRASALVKSASGKAPEKLFVPTVKPTPPPKKPLERVKAKKTLELQAVQIKNSKKQRQASPTEKQTEASRPRPTVNKKAPTPETAQTAPTRQPSQEQQGIPAIPSADEDVKIVDSSFEIQPFQDRIDIPPPTLQTQCTGKRLIANSKTRVWGTVIKLINRPSNEILDERMKCDIPNEVEICLDTEPVQTSTGHAVARLLADLDLGGCEKFKSGEAVYILKTDFISY